MSEIDIQDALERLKQEFIDTSAEKLDKIDGIIDQLYRGSDNDRGADFVEFQRDIHSLKGSAGTYGFGSVSLIAHRLEDYIETTRQLTSENLLDVQKYIDRIREILEGRDEIAPERLSGILDSLPTSGPAQTASTAEENVVALLVMAKGVQRKLVTTDLSNNGFELAYADHPLEAFRLAVSLKPNLIITSLEFDNLSGLELAKALRGVDAMSEIPVILLTSHAVEGMSEALPPYSRAIHKDSHFAAKLTDTLQDLGFSTTSKN
jgi:CheY-like chemotaxis protein/HPt (histidine-containing phosphotransfer) domain-containing protein